MCMALTCVARDPCTTLHKWWCVADSCLVNLLDCSHVVGHKLLPNTQTQSIALSTSRRMDIGLAPECEAYRKRRQSQTLLCSLCDVALVKLRKIVVLAIVVRQASVHFSCCDELSELHSQRWQLHLQTVLQPCGGAVRPLGTRQLGLSLYDGFSITISDSCKKSGSRLRRSLEILAKVSHLPKKGVAFYMRFCTLFSGVSDLLELPRRSSWKSLNFLVESFP